MNNSEFSLEKKSVTTDAGRIYYYLNSDFPGQPTILYLHGLSSNHTTWIKTAATMHEHGYNGLLVEQRGHGHSDKSKRRSLYRMPVFSRDLAAVIADAGIGNIVLVGYSYGGVIALDYAVNHPETLTGLVLISTNHKNPLRYRHLGWLTPGGRAIVRSMAFLLRWQQRRQYYYYDPFISRSYWHSVFEGFTTMPLSINLWMLEQMGKIDYSAGLKRISVPTLLIYSKNDPFVTKAEVDDMLKGLPRASAAVSANDSHFIASQSQAEVTEILLKFITKIESK